ncbi:class I SAM-dependent methyltransferase [Aquirufa sp. A-Brett2-15D]
MSNLPHSENGKIYDLLYESRFGFMYNDFTNKSISAITTILTSGKIIDVGCGTGRLAIPLAQKNYDVVGIDLSEVMIDELKLKALRLDLQVLTSTNQYKLENQNCDLALAVFTVFAYTLDEVGLKLLFEDIYRHLKVGGSFLFDLPLPGMFQHHETMERNGLNWKIDIQFVVPGEPIANYSETVIVNLPEFQPNHTITEFFQIRCWKLDEITNLFESCGFGKITQVRGLEGTGANYYVCKKEI